MNHEFMENGTLLAAFAGAFSSATVQRFSLKNYQRATIIIVQNKAGSAAGSAIAMTQRSGASGTPKTLGFTKAKRALAVGTQAAPVYSWAEFDVAANTFTTDDTDSVRDVYVIDVKAEDLDIDGGYDIVELTCGDAANNTGTVVVLGHAAKFGTFPPKPFDQAA